MGARSRRSLVGPSQLLDALCVLALAVPFAVVAIRYLASSGTVYLSDDLALLDLHVRDALHWQQQLGPFDRFGWNHPGPAVFYVMSVAARIVGSGARAEFVGAIVVNLLAALGTVWVVRRRCGPLAALWASSCLGVLAIVIGSTTPGAITTSEGPLGALVSPWNPDIVIFPLVLFCVLAAAGACDSPVALLGAALVASFVVQTNLSTLVIVAVLLVAACAWAAACALSRRRPARTGRGSGPRHHSSPTFAWARAGAARPARPALWVGGVILLVAMWIPPIVQQFTHRTGNLTLIWRFFTSQHQGVSIGHSFWAVLAVDAELPFGVAQEMSSRRLGNPHADEFLVLAAILVLVAACMVLGRRRRIPFAATLGLGSFVGFVFAVFSVTRIVGPVYGYLVVWEVAVPLAALIGLGCALFAAEGVKGPRRRPARGVGRLATPRSTRVTTIALMALALVVGSVLTVQTARIPPLSRASDPTVARAFEDVSAHLRPGRRHVFVGDAGTNINGLFTFFGLVDQLQEHAYHPRVSSLWRTQVGPQYLSNGTEPVQVVLYPPSARIRQMTGYIGSVANADIVIQPGPPLP